MRLICPNCGAQYDVPTEVIPAGGRDVQCSNCGHTWYQRHPDQDAALAEDLGQAVPDPEWTPEAEAEPPAPPPRVQRRPELRPAPRPDARPAPRTAATPPPAPPPAAGVQTPPPPPVGSGPDNRSLDPEMEALFREERDYEARQRAAEAFESQPELGLAEVDEDEQARRSRQARERMARLRGDDPSTPRAAPRRPAPSVPPSALPVTAPVAPEPEASASAEAVAAAAAASSRRDLLPDVDEINQTLRSGNAPRMIDAAERSQAPVRPERSGFGRGFMLTLLLAAAAIGVYVFAPQISGQLPQQAAPYLDAYVTQVNDGRAWLDGQVVNLLQMLDTMSSEAGGGAAPAEGS